MLNTNRQVSKTGECDICGQFETKVIQTPGNIWMCEPCKVKEDKLQEENTAQASARVAEQRLKNLVDVSKQIDQNVQLKTDIFLAKTVAAVELKAAIQQDETVAESDKQFTYARECQTRFLHTQEVIFGMRQALADKENEMRMWQTQGQEAVSKLRTELRAQFKQLDVNYQPVAPKLKKVSTPDPNKLSRTEKKEQIKKFAAQYNVPEVALTMLVTAMNLSPEAAAKKLVESGGTL